MGALHHNFFNGTITDNPLSSGATTVSSAQFADLPAISGSTYIWVVLDPLGVAGDPELIKVTAHTLS